MTRTTAFLLAAFAQMGIAGQSASLVPPDGMVLIPGGTCMLGSGSQEGSIAYPPHSVTLESFFMDAREVTNREYAVFCRETGHRYPEFWEKGLYFSGPDYPDHPVVGVSHADASRYAEWAGKRLPTEAEWEYAARSGNPSVRYPFGPAPDHSLARYNDPDAPEGPVQTGTYESNEFGLYDMSGNVWEWVADWFGPGYYEDAPAENPAGPSQGTFRVFRGGGWHSGPGCISVHHRNALPPHWVDMAGGFRCVRDCEPQAILPRMD